MRRFAALFAELEATSKTGRKVDALVRYFAAAPSADAAWALFFLSGERLKRTLAPSKLGRFAVEASGFPPWLVEECWESVGDFAETLALLVPRGAPAATVERTLTQWVEEVLLPLRDASEEEQRAAMQHAWTVLDARERLVLHKLLTGEFRVGVSRGLVLRAVARHTGHPERVVATRLAGTWKPSAESWDALLAEESGVRDPSTPYPFLLAHPLEEEPQALGDPRDWAIEWKWDGIRGQLVRREGHTYLWSRGEELITDRFPEIVAAAEDLPDGTVLDGEILAWQEDRPLPFQTLQRRIGRRTLTPRILAQVPVAYLAFDLLEDGGRDVREEAWQVRRGRLESLFSKDQDGALRLQEAAPPASWEEVGLRREDSREHAAEGLMLKRRDASYGVGRVRGTWWKWKVVPFTVDAVLVYAQRGHGQRASLYTDYTFALWKGGELVPFAKAYSGLTDEEIRRVDAFVRRNTIERFGPVRRVEPQLVFELAFEGIQASSRHKSGVAVRFPRIARWREDKRAEEADTLEAVVSKIA